jgi:hypothetical protein
MKQVHPNLLALVSAAVVGAWVSGCEERSVSSIQPVGPTISANPTPEESFELIAETFRRGIEDGQIGFRVPREGGHSMLAGSNEVTHELIRPTKDGDPYRGIITVISTSQYSMKRSGNREDDTPRDEQSSNQESSSALEEASDISGVQILDPNLAPTSSATGSTSRSTATDSENRVTRRQNQTDRKYELVYQDGRWSLVTELDPKTEQSIQYAFDHALKTQI